MSNIIEESKDSVFNTTHCKCYPTCDHTQYHAATFTDRLGTSDSRGNQFEIDVYFQEETLFSYRSTLHITMLDLMGEVLDVDLSSLFLFSDCFNYSTVSYGGIAGLFLGLSVVGAINSVLDRITCCSKPTPQPIKPDPEVKRASRLVTCNQKNMNE